MQKRTECFNTSHVSINLGIQSDDFLNAVVSIHLMFLLIIILGTCSVPLHGFNTSHVSINPQRGHRGDNRTGVSIHLMFLLIAVKLHYYNFYQSFNTSHVSINQRKGTVDMEKVKFQYISCFY